MKEIFQLLLKAKGLCKFLFKSKTGKCQDFFLDGPILLVEKRPIADLETGKCQAPVVQRLDNAIHRINHYPADRVICFVNTYPLDSDLSGG